MAKGYSPFAFKLLCNIRMKFFVNNFNFLPKKVSVWIVYFSIKVMMRSSKTAN